ncbi:developmentally-regulated protein [Acrasis kona]|uniref:Developmentally-regulated protein n=1 Tax=Acrasis kona TaxID=1008807 RepID=A0AAW2ZQX0_9EUKA
MFCMESLKLRHSSRLMSSHRESLSNQPYKNFITLNMSRRPLLPKDTVMIRVPEDIEIHGGVEPGLNGKIGIVNKIYKEEVEVYILKSRVQERVLVPMFAIYLEDEESHMLPIS